MGQRDKYWYLLTYDVVNPRRLRRIHRSLLADGIPVQRSVFFIYCSKQKIEQILNKCVDLLDLEFDDLAVFHTDSPDSIWRYGVGADQPLLHLSQQDKTEDGENNRSIWKKLGSALLWKD